MSLNIELVCSNRERALRGCPEASATFTFTISDGPFKARAEVMLSKGGVEIIERAGKKAKAAARLALERLLVEGCDPSKLQSFYGSHTGRPNCSPSTATSTRSPGFLKSHRTQPEKETFEAEVLQSEA